MLLYALLYLTGYADMMTKSVISDSLARVPLVILNLVMRVALKPPPALGKG